MVSESVRGMGFAQQLCDLHGADLVTFREQGGTGRWYSIAAACCRASRIQRVLQGLFGKVTRGFAALCACVALAIAR